MTTTDGIGSKNAGGSDDESIGEADESALNELQEYLLRESSERELSKSALFFSSSSLTADMNDLRQARNDEKHAKAAAPVGLEAPMVDEKDCDNNLFKQAEAMLTYCDVVYNFVAVRVLARRSNNEELMKALQVPQFSSTLGPAMVRCVQELQHERSSEKADKFAKKIVRIMNVQPVGGAPRSEGATHPIPIPVTAGAEVFYVADSEEHLAQSSVWVAAVNRLTKRITIVFRGTEKNENEDGKTHWSTNLDTAKRWELTPIEDMEREMPFFTIHNGFMKALAFSLKEIFRTIQDIRETYPETASYPLYITGHSLGGALATVLAYHAVQEPSITKHGPVTVYTFAQPSVGGDEKFVKIMNKYMEQGKLRYARFLNDGDIVPHYFGENFKHVGIEIKLHSEGYEVKAKGQVNKMRAMIRTLMSPKQTARKHGCSTTVFHLDNFEHDFAEMTLEELCQETRKQLSGVAEELHPDTLEQLESEELHPDTREQEESGVAVTTLATGTFSA